MIALYELPPSGNCWKIRLLLSMLGLPHRRIAIDKSKGENRTAEFLRMNPLGQVPVLVDGSYVLRDSQAILVYLASKYGGENWWPDDSAILGNITAWLSMAANEIANGPAALRSNRRFGKPLDVENAARIAHSVLEVIEAHLSAHRWLVGQSPTIADIAVFPYLALADEAAIDLAGYPNTGGWLMRIKQLPGYVDL